MALELSKVHEHKREEGTNRMLLIRLNPYARFVSAGHPPVLVQGGRFYSDGGDLYEKGKEPDWVFSELKNMSLTALKDVGLTLDDLIRGTKKSIPDKAFEPTVVVMDAGPKSLPSSDEKEESEEGQNLIPIPSLDEQVLLALSRLDPTEDTHWTKSGFPDLNTLKEALGRRITRGKVQELAPDLTRPSFGE